MKASINHKEHVIDSVESLGMYLDELDSNNNAEAWLFHPAGASMCLLKSNDSMFLMYLRNAEDTGFVSLGKEDETGVVEYILCNGQADEYPKSWCIDSEWAYKSLAYFFVNDGEKTPYVKWMETE